MKKILVTGGAGYIGAHTVVELYNAGFEIVIIDNLSKTDDSLIQGISQIIGRFPLFLKGDCLDKQFLNNIFLNHGPIAAVIHFAAYKSVGESVIKPLMYYENNLGSLINLLEVMTRWNVSDLIFSSSCTVYGQPESIPVNEAASFKPAESPYGATKQMCERILSDTFKKGLRIISLRYFNPIGAHPSGLIGELPIGVPNNLVPYITQTAAKLREKLVVFGNDYNTPDGSNIRDYIHVVDVATAHVKALKYLDEQDSSPMFEAFNLGTGKGVSVLEVVNEFIKVTGINFPYEIGNRRPGDVEKVYADPSKLNKAFKWKTQYTLTEALQHAWAWEKRIRGLN